MLITLDPISVLLFVALIAAYNFFTNIYIEMLLYSFIAVSLVTTSLYFHLFLAIVVFIGVCIYPPFSIAYKIFLFGVILSVVRGKLHGSKVYLLDNIAGVAIVVGVAMGFYNIFAQ